MNGINRCPIQVDSSTRRPDFIERYLNNIVWNGPTLIGIAKGEYVEEDIHGTLLDLIRIGRFSKKSIDTNFYEGVLGIHVVGLKATIYFICLIHAGLYTTMEVCSIRMPRDATQLKQYLASCEDLLPIHGL